MQQDLLIPHQSAENPGSTRAAYTEFSGLNMYLAPKVISNKQLDITIRHLSGVGHVHGKLIADSQSSWLW
jgi:hypothetical protein